MGEVGRQQLWSVMEGGRRIGSKRSGPMAAQLYLMGEAQATPRTTLVKSKEVLQCPQGQPQMPE